MQVVVINVEDRHNHVHVKKVSTLINQGPISDVWGIIVGKKGSFPL